MNIKVKATLEIALGITGMVVIIAGVRAILTTLTDIYGIDTVLNGMAFCAVSTAAYIAVSLLYDIRVAQLKYKETLQEMTKKG